MRRSCLPLASCLVLAGVMSAQAPSGVVRTVDGRVLQGRFTVVDGIATIAGDGGETRLDVADLQGFDPAGITRLPVAVDSAVWLRSGQRLPVRTMSCRPKTGSTPPALVVELPSGASLELPLAMLRALRHGGAERPEPALFLHDLEAPPANDDLLYVVKGDQQQRSSVTISGLQPEHVEFVLRGRALDFEFTGVAGIVFGKNTGFPPDRQEKPRTRVELTSGEVVEGRLLAVGDTVRCRLDEGCVLEVPSARLASLQVASDRLVWLGQLTPQVQQTAAFDRVWPWTVDRSIAGPGFQLGGKTFLRGIGMLPRTRLSYDLGGRYDLFEATVGIDDRGGPEAHTILRVLVDGAVAYESAPKTLGGAPEVLRIELKKAKTLAIEADFGKNYDLGDYCVFADARVVQQ